MNTLFVVGIGPGGPEFLTGEAREALSRAQAADAADRSAKRP